MTHILPLVRVVIADKQLVVGCALLVTLPEIIHTAHAFDADIVTLPQFPNFRAIVVGNKKFTLYSHKRITQPYVIFFCKSNVLVIAFRSKIRRIAVEKAAGTIVMLYQYLKVLIFNYYFL
mgnify:CR=1 FL=1